MRRSKGLYCCSEDEESSYYASSTNMRGEESDDEGEDVDNILNNELTTL